MRSSNFLLATVKETPSDAEIISHQLMLRAGMIRKVAAGIYNWLPLGFRTLKKVERIVREEMNRTGSQELLLPAVQPAELWQESGRWDLFGGELLRLKDRHDRDFCFGPTHEEVITTMVGNEIRSYKQLPASFYQIQTKFRDERRPRFGVMRAREFLMKDAYSFHRDEASLQEFYAEMHEAYTRVFTRLGLNFRPVEADTGSIGGSGSHEFHVLANSGEDAIATCDKYDYAANVELAKAARLGGDRASAQEQLSKVATPDKKTIAAISTFLNVPVEKTIKTLLVKGAEHDAVALVLRGDHELNELKAEKHSLVASPLEWLEEDEVLKAVGCGVGSIGTVGIPIPVIADLSAANLSDFICGANEDDVHYIGANWGRDCPEPDVFDLRSVVEGDLCARAGDVDDGHAEPDDRLTILRGIEVGHIFQLGTKYSEPLGANYLDQNGKAEPMVMGTYGIGISRIVAAAIEQNYDDRGIIWPANMAPFELVITPIGYHKSELIKRTSDRLYNAFTELGIEVLLDDRNERPGIMFADADLIGVPHRLVVGEKSLANGKLEYKARSAEDAKEFDAEHVVDLLAARITGAR